MVSWRVLSLANIMVFCFGLSTPSVAGPTEALRGGMDSGGAGLYGSDHNPWFLPNTPRIKYCLDSNPATFHQSLDVVDQMIKDAFKDWRSVFESSEKTDPVEVPGYGVLHVATQQLERGNCSDKDIDLRFQLGVLSEEQKKNIGDEHQWIGAAYRTDYNEETLRGKGFIYIAADAGPDRPTSGELVEDMWRVCDGCLLRRTLVHELGHVFGLGHVGNSWDIMSEGHLEKVTSVKWVLPNLSTPKKISSFNTMSHLGSYLRAQMSFSVRDCGMIGRAGPKLRDILALPKDTACVDFVANGISGEFQFGFASGGADEEELESPAAVTRALQPRCDQSGKNELGWLYLPPTQKVFNLTRSNVTPANKFPIAFAYERTICFGRTRDSSVELARKNKNSDTTGKPVLGAPSAIPMTLVFSRDGSIVGTAMEAGDPDGLLFTTSLF